MATSPPPATRWTGWVDFELESPVAAEVIENSGAILAGRRWHDLAIERWDGRGGIYGGNWKGPVTPV
jgi:hypothetical protein